MNMKTFKALYRWDPGQPASFLGGNKLTCILFFEWNRYACTLFSEDLSSSIASAICNHLLPWFYAKYTRVPKAFRIKYKLG